MIIRVSELCEVDYVHEIDVVQTTDETEESLRHIVYDSPCSNIKDALVDYEENFDMDNMISSYDDFVGQCLNTIRIVSVKEENFFFLDAS